jgi:hypothetical protein
MYRDAMQNTLVPRASSSMGALIGSTSKAGCHNLCTGSCPLMLIPSSPHSSVNQAHTHPHLLGRLTRIPPFQSSMSLRLRPVALRPLRLVQPRPVFPQGNPVFRNLTHRMRLIIPPPAGWDRAQKPNPYFSGEIIPSPINQTKYPPSSPHLSSCPLSLARFVCRHTPWSRNTLRYLTQRHLN